MSESPSSEVRPSLVSKLTIVCCYLLGIGLFGNAVWYGGSATESADTATLSLAEVVRSVVFIQNGQATGTGFVVDSDGAILTNAHVVDGADMVRIRTSGGRGFDAVVESVSDTSDVAIVRADSADLPVLLAAEPGLARQGDEIYVIGFPLGDLLSDQASTTKGIISNLDGPDGRIQVDAAINSGNSGGPVVSIDRGGVVIGIATAIVGDLENVGLVVPIERARELYEESFRRALPMPR